MERAPLVLKDQAKTFGLLNSIKIDSLTGVLNYPVFSGENKLAVIMDLDGVLCHFGKRNGWEEKMSKLRALTEIYKRSDKVIYSSARVSLFIQDSEEGDLFNKKNKPVEDNLLGNVLKPLVSLAPRNSVSLYPVFSASSKKKLLLLADKANPSCQVSFSIGLKKNIGRNEKVFNFASEALRTGLDVVVIGSSFFDKRMAKEIIKRNWGSDEKVTFFDTGCVWY